ncbi:unnamed protein product [Effrenium voratum]|nr:unnamed protein product [Effrenium voratum]
MEHLAKCTMKLLAGSSPETVEDSSREGSAPSFALLEQLSLERPEALHRQLGQFLPWLAASDVSGSLERPMAACGILAQVLPSWGAAASSLAKQKMARDLARSLARLLDEHTAPATDLGQLARQAVRCLAAVAEHLGAAGPQARELLMGHFGRSIRVLAEDVEDGQRLCRHSWILGSLLEFLDRGSLEQLAQAMARLPSSGASLAQCARSALLLLSEGCRSKSARPAMISALGFALKRFPELLDAEEAGVASPLALLRLALQGPAKARAAEAFAALSAGYQEAAEKGSPDCVKQPARSSASVAAQKLASLQPELLGALDAACYGPLLAGLRSLCDLGVLHPASTLPNILAATVAAPAIAAAHARPLLLRLVESSPPLLAQRLGAGLQLAAEKLAAEGYVEVYSESWRFQAVCEAYAEFLEGRALRDQFLTSLLGDLGSGLKLQLAVGILARLPLSKEPELARVFHCAVRFLTLKVAPLLDEAAEDAPGAEDARLCACGAVLHRLCVQWLGLVGGELVRQMRETWAQPTLATDFDQALPMSFKRRSVVDLSELWRLEGVESHGLLLREMENSPLLGKAVRPAALAAPKAVPKKRSAEEPKGPKAKARKQATEAAASAKAAAVAMSKAAAGA